MVGTPVRVLIAAMPAFAESLIVDGVEVAHAAERGALARDSRSATDCAEDRIGGALPRRAASGKPRTQLPTPCPSFAFVAQPQTNGVAERFNRTLKEQAIYGRVFRNIEEVRRAVAEFVERYNTHWRLEKLDFKTPYEVRQAAGLKQAA